MNTNKTFLVVSVASFLFFTGLAQTTLQTYQDQEMRYSIDYPATW